MDVKIIILLWSRSIHVMSVYYVQPLYIHIMFKNVKIKTIFFYEDENISFYFLGTKIEFAIFIGTKNLFNPCFYFDSSFHPTKRMYGKLVIIYVSFSLVFLVGSHSCDLLHRNNSFSFKAVGWWKYTRKSW